MAFSNFRWHLRPQRKQAKNMVSSSSTKSTQKTKEFF